MDTIRSGGVVGSRQARREAARVAVADEIDGLSEAMSVGVTTGDHVDSLARHTKDLTDEQRAMINFGRLVEEAGRVPVETFDRLVKRRVTEAVGDHGLGDTMAKQAASEFRHWFDHTTGMGRFSGSLDPERYETLTNAVEHHTRALAAASNEPVALTRNLAARTLVELVTSSSGVRDQRNRLPSVTVVVDHDTIVDGPHAGSVRQTENGHDLAPESIARLCCDAVIRRVVLDERGVPVDVGRKHRTATDGQWAAIKAVHSSCGWDGCEAPITWCQAHHIREWEHEGPTDLDNLIPLCSQHHHRVHEGQWHIKLRPDRTLEIHQPDGTHHSTVPTPRRC